MKNFAHHVLAGKHIQLQKACASLNGMMTKLLLQVAHILSIVTAVEAAIPPEVVAMNQQQNQQPNAAKPAAYGSSAMKTQLRFSASVEIPLIAVLCLVRICRPV